MLSLALTGFALVSEALADNFILTFVLDLGWQSQTTNVKNYQMAWSDLPQCNSSSNTTSLFHADEHFILMDLEQGGLCFLQRSIIPLEKSMGKASRPRCVWVVFVFLHTILEGRMEASVTERAGDGKGFETKQKDGLFSVLEDT